MKPINDFISCNVYIFDAVILIGPGLRDIMSNCANRRQFD